MGENMLEKNETKETTRDIAILGSGRHIRLVKGRRWEWAERINATGIVLIVAVTPDDELILIEQFRPPVDARVIELPAGLAGDIPGTENEALEIAAIRELEEETGYRATEMQRLTSGPPSAGITSELITFFRAGDLVRTGDGGGDEHESIQVHRIKRNSVHHWLQEQESNGVMVDNKVYAGLYWALMPQDSEQ